MSVTPDLPSTDEGDPAPRQTAGERARADTRRRLIASGRALFAERGLHRTTTHDIAHHAGVAAGTFYNHFSDKHALFQEITDEAVAEFDRRLRAAESPAESLREGVRTRAEALVGFAEDHRELMRILFSRDGDAAAIGSDVLDTLARDIAESERMKSDTIGLPPTVDPTVRAQALVGMWARVLAWWAEDPSRAPRESVVDTLTHIQREGTHPA